MLTTQIKPGASQPASGDQTCNTCNMPKVKKQRTNQTVFHAMQSYGVEEEKAEAAVAASLDNLHALMKQTAELDKDIIHAKGEHEEAVIHANCVKAKKKAKTSVLKNLNSKLGPGGLLNNHLVLRGDEEHRESQTKKDFYSSLLKTMQPLVWWLRFYPMEMMILANSSKWLNWNVRELWLNTAMNGLQMLMWSPLVERLKLCYPLTPSALVTSSKGFLCELEWISPHKLQQAHNALQLALAGNDTYRVIVQGSLGRFLNCMVGSLVRFANHAEEWIPRAEMSTEAAELIDSLWWNKYDNMAYEQCKVPAHAWYLVPFSQASAMGQEKTVEFLETVLTLLQAAVAYKKSSNSNIQAFRAILVDIDQVLLLPQTNVSAFNELITKMAAKKRFYYDQEANCISEIDYSYHRRTWMAEPKEGLFTVAPKALKGAAVRLNGD